MSDADVDALVLAVDGDLPPPAVTHDDVVLVSGPWLAGTTAVIAALRARLPRHTVVEPAEMRPGAAPAALVFVASAAAPLTESDCALLDAAAADTDAVIGVVTKIDVHRTWRDVLDADRRIAAAHAPRYAGMPWVGVAAAPDLGAPVVDDLVGAVEHALADDSLYRRNRLRAWETRLTNLVLRHRREEARVTALREQRFAAVRQARRDKTERAIALRSRMQQARVQLSHFARGRCAAVRTELQEVAASSTRRQFTALADRLRRRFGEVTAEVDVAVTRQVSGLSTELGLTVEYQAPPAAPAEVPPPPLRSRQAETRLMTLLGAGFGLGVALTLSRLLADLAPQWTAAGVIACAAVGVVLTLWVVGTRGLLHDRAVLDRWVAEVTSGLRAGLEERVATGLLAAESALGVAAAERDSEDSARVERTVAAIDREAHQHATSRARAGTEIGLRMPALARALTVVRAELGAAAETESMNGPL